MSIFSRKGHTLSSVRSWFKKVEESDACLRCECIVSALDWFTTDTKYFGDRIRTFPSLGFVILALARCRNPLMLPACFGCLGVLFVFLILI